MSMQVLTTPYVLPLELLVLSCVQKLDQIDSNTVAMDIMNSFNEWRLLHP